MFGISFGIVNPETCANLGCADCAIIWGVKIVEPWEFMGTRRPHAVTKSTFSSFHTRIQSIKQRSPQNAGGRDGRRPVMRIFTTTKKQTRPAFIREPVVERDGGAAFPDEKGSRHL